MDNKNSLENATSEVGPLFISEQSWVNITSDEFTWVVNFGASFHLTPKRDFFSSYIAVDYDDVKMGNDGACKIASIGSVCLLTSIGCRMLLKDVPHVQDIRLNLISIGRLDDEGYSGSFQRGMWKFYKGNLIVSRAQKKNMLYVMPA